MPVLRLLAGYERPRVRREPLCRTPPIFGTVRPQSMMCGLLFRAAKVGICGVKRENANSGSDQTDQTDQTVGLGVAFAGAAFCRRAGSGGFRNAGQGESPLFPCLWKRPACRLTASREDKNNAGRLFERNFRQRGASPQRIGERMAGRVRGSGVGVRLSGICRPLRACA